MKDDNKNKFQIVENKEKESIKMVEDNEKKLGDDEKKVKKVIAKASVKLSMPNGPLKIEKGADCSKFSRAIKKKLHDIGVI